MSDPGVNMGGTVDGTDVEDRTVTFTNLLPRSNYTIDVRAVFTDFTVSPPVIISGTPAEIVQETPVSPGTSF